MGGYGERLTDGGVAVDPEIGRKTLPTASGFPRLGVEGALEWTVGRRQ